MSPAIAVILVAVHIGLGLMGHTIALKLMALCIGCYSCLMIDSCTHWDAIDAWLLRMPIFVQKVSALKKYFAFCGPMRPPIAKHYR